MDNSKKKSIIVSAAICAMMTVCGTMAYFTDNEATTNKFHVGKIDIQLLEPNWSTTDSNSDGIPNASTNIVPRQQINKNPQVKNIGLDDAYVYLKVTIPRANIFTAKNDGTKNARTPTTLFTLNGVDTAHWDELTDYRVTTDTSETKVYAYSTAVAPNNTTTALFTSVTFCNAIEGQGLENSAQNINVNAYAIQSANSGTVAEAYAKYIKQNS